MVVWQIEIRRDSSELWGIYKEKAAKTEIREPVGEPVGEPEEARATLGFNVIQLPKSKHKPGPVKYKLLPTKRAYKPDP